MEQQNIATLQHLQTPQTIEVVPNMGACYVIDDNPENKAGGFDVASDEKTEDSTAHEIDPRSDNDNAEDRKIKATSYYKPEDVINRELSDTLQNNVKENVVQGLDLTPKSKLEDSTGERCCVTLHGTSDYGRNMLTNQTTDDNPQDGLDGRFGLSSTDSVSDQTGYEGDVDTIKDGESSGNVTDSDTETKKNYAEKAKLVIQKAITRLDSITEDIAEVVTEKRSDEEDSEEPGSSCTDTMVSDYGTTDLEKDTNIPRHILYKLLGKENKCSDSISRCSKNTKRKLSTEDG